MSQDAKALRAAWNAQNQVTVKLEKFGLISLRMPTAHEFSMAMLRAKDEARPDDRDIVSRNACRDLCGKCLQSWSVTPALLLGDLAKGDKRDEPMPASEDNALLFFDVFDDAYSQIANEFMAEYMRRRKAEETAEKN
jgi:hypothetical protein